MRKRDKLYTVNKHNRPLFMPKENLFPEGGELAKSLLNFGPTQLSTNALVKSNTQAVGKALTDKLGSLGGAEGGSFNPWGAIGAVSGQVSDMLSGGHSSGVGTGLKEIGRLVKNVPVIGKFGALAEMAGGAFDGLFGGPKADEAKLKAAREGTNTLRNFKSNANNFDEIVGPQAVQNVGKVYTDSLLGSGSDELNEDLQRQRAEAKQFADRSVANNVGNLIANQNSQLQRDWYAYGGDLNMGPVELDLAYAALAAKRQKTQNEDKMNNMFMGVPKTVFDFGGTMQTNSADYGTGLVQPIDDLMVSNLKVLPVERKQNFSDSEYFWDAGAEYPSGLWRHKDGTFHTKGVYGKDIVLTQEEADNIIRANKAKNRRERLKKAMESHKHSEGGQMTNYTVGQVYDISEAEANRLKAMGYEFAVVS